MALKRKKRVILHPKDEKAPSIEGLLVSKRRDEYVLAGGKLHLAANAVPAELESRLSVVPKANVAFYEVL